VWKSLSIEARVLQVSFAKEPYKRQVSFAKEPYKRDSFDICT